MRSQSHLSVVVGLIKALCFAYPDARIYILVCNPEVVRSNNKEKNIIINRRGLQKYSGYIKRFSDYLRTALLAHEYHALTLSYNYENLEALVYEINVFKPDITFFWGGIHNCEKLKRVIYGNYPVVFCFFNNKNRVNRLADIYLARVRDQVIYGPHQESKVAYQPFAVYVPDDGFNYPMDHIVRKVNDVILITVISQDRLFLALQGYRKETLDYFFSAFNRNENIRWIFVVGSNGRSSDIAKIDPRFEFLIKNGRIMIHDEWEPHLRALYRLCDLYVHLPGLTGGGGGVSMARAEALATLCFNGSDACNVQWPGAIYHDEKHLFDDIVKLAGDRMARIKLGIKVKEYVLRYHSLDVVSNKLIKNLQQALNNYAMRSCFFGCGFN